MNYVVIFAGGVGARMGKSTPKQFLEVDNKPIIVHTVEKFSVHGEIDGIVIVCVEDYIPYCWECVQKHNLDKVIDIIPGGTSGQDSIYQGLNYLHSRVINHSSDVGKDNIDDAIVLIHDGVRPIITSELIHDSIASVKENGNSIAVSKAIETVITVDENGEMQETINRAMCRNAKAPQCFYLKDIYSVHQRARVDGYNELMVDSASLMSFYGHKLYTVECAPENIKITTPNDYYMFKALYEDSNELK